MNELKIFENEAFGQIRALELNGEPWFVGKDVAAALGYGTGKAPVNAVANHVDLEDKGVTELMTPGGTQKMTIINESGLYSLVLSSKLPTAKAFKRWVTHDVLPSIRKHGAYATPETLDKMISSPEFGIKLLTALKEEQDKRGRLELENAQQRQIIGELKPLADYTSVILQNPGLVTITQIAKDYGMSGRAMNRLLAEKGVQYKQSGQWLLYQKYHDKGYTHSKTIDIVRTDGTKDVRMETKWTQKGRLFLYELLKADGILPVIERDMTA